MPESVEDVCPEMPRLDALMKDINDMSESGARYTEMPHVIEVVLPMLCNYLSYWWERGPENRPGVCSSTVTSEHLSVVLGNILKILNSNLGIDEASWMKRIAGEQSCEHTHSCVQSCRKTFVPLTLTKLKQIFIHTDTALRCYYNYLYFELVCIFIFYVFIKINVPVILFVL